jgi:hypothetical protein
MIPNDMSDEELNRTVELLKGQTILIQSFAEFCTSTMNDYHEIYLGWYQYFSDDKLVVLILNNIDILTG